MIPRLLLICAVSLLSLTSIASAQTGEDLLNFFRSMGSSDDRAARAWARLSAREIACVNRALRRQGSSVEAYRRSGIPPSDGRIAPLRAKCRTQFARNERVPLPLVAPRSVRPQSTTAESAPAPSAPSQPATSQSTPSQSPAIAASRYVIDGFTLGNRLPLESARYAAFQCAPSEQYSGLTWCHKSGQERSGRVRKAIATSILHRQDGTAAYINQSSEPERFGRHGFQKRIDQISDRLGEQPRILRAPKRDGVPSAIIALWGKVDLEPLGADSMATLASGESPRVGLLLDYLGDFRRSARLGLPVYRLTSGPGLIWSASARRNGRGHIRTLVFDASLTTPADQIVSPVAPVAGEIGSPAGQAEADKAAADARRAAREAVTAKALLEKALAEKAAAEKAEAEKAAAERAAAERAAAERAAAERAAAERAAVERAAAERADAERAAAEAAGEETAAAAERAAAEKSAAEKAAAEELAAAKAEAERATADRIAAAKAAAEQAAADREAATRAAAERETAERVAAAKAAAEQAAAEKVAAARAAAEQAAAEKLSAARAAAEKAVAEKLAAAKAAAKKATEDQVAAARAATEKAAAEKVAAAKASAEEAAARKLAAARAAAEKATAEKVAAAKAATEKAAAEELAAAQAAAEKATARKVAAAKAAAEKAAAEKLAAAKAAAERATTERIAAVKAAVEKAAAKKLAAAKAKAEEAAAKKIAAAQAAAKRAAEEKAAAEKAARKAAEERIAAAEAAAQKAAEEKIAAAQAAAKRATARLAAAEAAAQKAAEDKIAAAQAAAEQAAAEMAAAEDAAQAAAAEKIAAAESEAAAKIAAALAEKAALEKQVAERVAALAERAAVGETLADKSAGRDATLRPAKFRSLYVGMSSEDFYATVKRLGFDVRMQLSMAGPPNEREYQVLLEVLDKKLKKPLMYVDVRHEGSNLRKFTRLPQMKVIDQADNYAVYSGVNPREIPKSVIRRLVIYPRFFEAQAMRVKEFSEYLLDKYVFVGDRLFDGTAKDQCNKCLVGLLASGESVVLKYDGNNHWWVEVETASSEFAAVFRAPKF